MGEVGHQEAVTAVVAGTAQHLDTLNPGPAMNQRLKAGARRPGHQGNPRNTVILYGTAVQFTGLGGGVEVFSA